MTDLKTQIQEDMKTAMRSHDKERLAVIRFLLSAIKQREIDERITLDDAQVFSVIEKSIKQRRDSIDLYQKAGRDDLVQKEQFEMDVLKEYMPEPLSESELETLIKAAIESTGATSMKEMGTVINTLKTQIQGRADMKLVSQKVKQLLS